MNYDDDDDDVVVVVDVVLNCMHYSSLLYSAKCN
jgi:hypothetical protein